MSSFLIPTRCIEIQHDLFFTGILKGLDQTRAFIYYGGLVFRLDHLLTKDFKHHPPKNNHFLSVGPPLGCAQV